MEKFKKIKLKNKLLMQNLSQNEQIQSNISMDNNEVTKNKMDKELQVRMTLEEQKLN